MKKRRAFALLLSVVISLTCVTETVLAAETEPNNSMVRYTTTIEERDRIFEAEMDQIMTNIKNAERTRGPQYQYKTEYLPYQEKTVGGYAGNQLAGGYRFSTGGGFYFSEEGGPEISASVSVALPAPYNFISFSVNLGNKASSGIIVDVPNTTDYFKLYVEKDLELRPYVVYKKPVGQDGEWEIERSGVVPVVIRMNPYAKKV